MQEHTVLQTHNACRVSKWLVATVTPLIIFTCGCSTFYGTRISKPIEPHFSVAEPQFLNTIGHLLGSGLTKGNKITPLINGDKIFPSMLTALRAAQKTINLESYIFEDEMGDEFSRVLSERARAGVKVHVLLDWVGMEADDAQIKRMTKAGVEVQLYNPFELYNPLRVIHRDHRKLLIVDGVVGFTGGAGVSGVYDGDADGPDHWRDTHFKVEGPAVAQMQAAFIDNWIRCTGEVLIGSDYFPDLKPAGEDRAQLFVSSPRGGLETVRLMYLLSIAAAKKSIKLAHAYFVPGPLLTHELIEARKRGVIIEIIVPGSNIDVQSVRNASRAKWGPLLKAGVKIFEYSPTMYHCKILIIDDVWVSVGSANFDNRSLRLNDEANLNVFAADLARALTRYFEEDKKQSHEVTYEEWRHRSLWKRLLELATLPLSSQL